MFEFLLAVVAFFVFFGFDPSPLLDLLSGLGL